MIQTFLIKKAVDMAISAIAKKHKLNKLQKYVEQDNELDIQMKQAQKTISKQGKYIEELEKKVAALEKDSHPPLFTMEDYKYIKSIKSVYERINKLEKEK